MKVLLVYTEDTKKKKILYLFKFIKKIKEIMQECKTEDGIKHSIFIDKLRYFLFTWMKKV